MLKSDLIKFLEPFSENIEIKIEIDDGIEPQEVDFDPVYKLVEGAGVVFLQVDNEEI